MTTKLPAKKQGQELAQNSGNDMVSLAIEKGIDGDALMKLMDAAERQSKEVARREWHNAMAQFQARCPVIKRIKKGNKNKYAPFEHIMRIIRPILSELGMSITFSETLDGDSRTTVCNVHHVGGHTDSSGSFTGAALGKLHGGANSLQEAGSGQAYGKRYALKSALGIIDEDEDDDGGRPAECISDSQGLDLLAAIEDSGIPLVRVLKWAGINELKDMPLASFAEACKRVSDYAKTHKASE